MYLWRNLQGLEWILWQYQGGARGLRLRRQLPPCLPERPVPELLRRGRVRPRSQRIQKSLPRLRFLCQPLQELRVRLRRWLLQRWIRKMHQKGLQLQARLKMQEIKARSFCCTPFFDSFWLFRVAVQSTTEFIYEKFIETLFIFQPPWPYHRL